MEDFKTRFADYLEKAVLVAVDFVYVVRICRKQTQVVGCHTGCKVFTCVIPPVSIVSAEIPFQIIITEATLSGRLCCMIPDGNQVI